MRRIFLILSLFVCSVSLFGQTENYKKRYDLLKSYVGVDGLGVETLLTEWQKADSTSADMMLAWFDYHYTKATRDTIIKSESKTYLGQQPLMSLKDTTGKDIYYFEDVVFDDLQYGNAMRMVDKLISRFPSVLDYRFTKVNMLVEYEKASPDMALSYILELIDEDKGGKRYWEFNHKKADADVFPTSMNEYCLWFYTIGSEASREGFGEIAQRMLKSYPRNLMFLNHLGSYYLVQQNNFKKALKYYNAVLKLKPDDYVAMKNSIIIARKQKNVKQERQLLNKFLDIAPEEEKLEIKARLKALELIK